MKKIHTLLMILLMGAYSTITTAQTDNLLKIAGMEPNTNGSTTYYLKNVGTGLHMSYGALYGTQCIETQAAHPIIVEDNGDGTFALASFGGYLNSENLYMDQAKSVSKWKLVKIAGYTNQYYLYGAGGHVLTSAGNTAGILTLKTPEGKASQRWIFTNSDDIRANKMPKASATCPLDMTMEIKGAAFDYTDSWEPTVNTPASLKSANPYNQAWANYNTYAKYGAHCGYRDTAEGYNYCGIINGPAEAVTVTYKMTLPKGTYHFSFEAFYKYMQIVTVQKQTQNTWNILDKNYMKWVNDGSATVTTTNSTMAAKVTIAGQSFNLSNYSDNSIYDNGAAVAAIFRDNDTYKHHGSFYLSSQQEVSIVISKPATPAYSESTKTNSIYTERTITTNSYPNQIYFDDFTLLYYGENEIAHNNIDENAEFKSYLNANIAEVTEGLCLQAMDVFYSTFGVDINSISTRKQYYEAFSRIDAALEAAKKAHLIYQSELYNHSFERGDYLGWTQALAVGSYMDTNVKDGSETGKDGTYRFNAWAEKPVVTPITQTVKGLENGLYELTALIASDAGNTVFLIGNGYHAGKVAESGNKFVKASLLFLVEDGTATVGAVGGSHNGQYYVVGGWYKVDDFHLRRVCDVAHGRLKLALDEATAVKMTLDAAGKAALNLSSYEATYNNKSLTGDGTNEVAAIRSALQAAAKAQTTIGADMTWAITNHSFETGNLTGWAVEQTGDTKIASQDHPTYSTVGADGRFVFNTWNNGVGYRISQTVTGIPNGTYKVTAMVASDAGNQISLTANNQTTTKIAAGGDVYPTGNVGFYPEVTCIVSNNQLVISVEGVNGVWYKADNFRLTYLAPETLVLSDTETVPTITGLMYHNVIVKRTISVNSGAEWSNWSTFVVPFNMAIPKDWEVKELISSTRNGDNISLVFDWASSIEAGVPYMVRVKTTNNQIKVQDVIVNTTIKNVETDDVAFIGTYAQGNIPTGSYYISGNKFYRSINTENPDKIKGFRAYFTPKFAAKSITFRMRDEEGTTEIEEQEVGEATIVAIYTPSGVRINEMQQGVNILQMSDGTTIKVIIK